MRGSEEAAKSARGGASEKHTTGGAAPPCDRGRAASRGAAQVRASPSARRCDYGHPRPPIPLRGEDGVGAVCRLARLGPLEGRRRFSTRVGFAGRVAARKAPADRWTSSRLPPRRLFVLRSAPRRALVRDGVETGAAPARPGPGRRRLGLRPGPPSPGRLHKPPAAGRVLRPSSRRGAGRRCPSAGWFRGPPRTCWPSARDALLVIPAGLRQPVGWARPRPRGRRGRLLAGRSGVLVLVAGLARGIHAGIVAPPPPARRRAVAFARPRTMTPRPDLFVVVDSGRREPTSRPFPFIARRVPQLGLGRRRVAHGCGVRGPRLRRPAPSTCHWHVRLPPHSSRHRCAGRRNCRRSVPRHSAVRRHLRQIHSDHTADRMASHPAHAKRAISCPMSSSIASAAGGGSHRTCCPARRSAGARDGKTPAVLQRPCKFPCCAKTAVALRRPC